MFKYKIKFNRWRGLENVVLLWGKINEVIMEEFLFVFILLYGDLKWEVLVVNVLFEFIFREGLFLEVDLNLFDLVWKIKIVIVM